MANGAPVKYTSAGYKASDVVLALPMILQLAEGFNPTATDLFLLFFNLTGVPAPGAIPEFPIAAPAGGSFSWGPIDLSAANQEGRDFSIGCRYAVSTTGNLYTASASAFWVDVTGRRKL